MKRLLSILLLLNFLLFTLPVNSGKSIAKQFLTSVPEGKEEGAGEMIDVNEFSVKLLQSVKSFNFSKDFYYVTSRDKFSHYILNAITVDWLETFSPPPDFV